MKTPFLSIMMLAGLSAFAPAALTLFYDFESDSDLSGGITDQSGNNRHGSAVGTVAFSTNVPAAIASRSTTSLSLTGSGNIVSDSPGYVGVTGTSGRTLSAWINSSVAADQVIAEWGGYNGNGVKYTVRLDEIGTSGNFGLRLEVNNGAIVGSTNLINGVWHHIAVVTPNNGSLADTIFYVNGIAETLSVTGTQALNTDANNDVLIGVRGDVTLRYFVGLMDEIAIFDEALSSSTIGALAGGAPVPEPSTTVYLAAFGLAVLRRRR